jgi:hypothetical protein
LGVLALATPTTHYVKQCIYSVFLVITACNKAKIILSSKINIVVIWVAEKNYSQHNIFKLLFLWLYWYASPLLLRILATPITP